MKNYKTIKKDKKTAFMVLICSLLISSAHTQEKIELWEGGIPGEIKSATYTEKQEMEGEQLVGVSQVTVPEMTLFKPSKPNGTAVVICPGGGYGFLAINKEGFKIAQWFNERGITAFVLKYRLPSEEIMEDKSIGPLQDAQQAIRLVRTNAKKYGIDENKVGIMGFSAGGHLASTLSTHYNKKVYENSSESSAKPDFSILIYPVISMLDDITHKGSRENLLGKSPTMELMENYSNEKQIDSATPKTFLIHAADDGAVPVENSLTYFTALNTYKVPAEMHIYENGGHGFGLGTGATHNAWPNALNLWLQTHKLLPLK
ncbi:alpha/beta hydrolase [Flavimarina sp. Hel_I_48]|uniref:alpha/beta hydrolase n=1 Tax=Flavimarina sp. Hel_I_48 TaxID=1392488 RepID=UPI0004DF75F4|nr:alpha/beta hydrolase [Flavimarina sp. Hel_I_48]